MYLADRAAYAPDATCIATPEVLQLLLVYYCCLLMLLLLLLGLLLLTGSDSRGLDITSICQIQFNNNFISLN